MNIPTHARPQNLGPMPVRGFVWTVQYTIILLEKNIWRLYRLESNHKTKQSRRKAKDNRADYNDYGNDH